MEEEKKIVADTSIEDAKRQAQKDRMARARAAKGKNKAAAPTPAFKPAEEKKKLPPIKLDSEIKWFTEVDFNDKGKVAVDYPAYYFDARINELKEELKALEEGIDEGVYTGKRLRDARDRLAAMKHKHDSIVDGMPKLKDGDKDKVARSFKEFHETIKESLFTYDEMWKQTADAHEEAKRMEKPCIQIPDEIVGSFARQRGYHIEGGKLSRNQAAVILKVMGKVLGETVNIDYRR